MARTTVLATLVALLAAFLWRQGRYLTHIALKQGLPSHYFAYGDAATKCKVVKDTVNDELGFCEDAVLWGGDKLLLSCDPNRLNWNTVMGPLRDPNPRGALWVYDYTKGSGSGKLHKLQLAGYPAHLDFHPLGVAVHSESDRATATHTAFVVNHGRNASTVEVFTLSPRAPFAATHVRTLAHPSFRAPNAVAPTSASSFYLSQDHYITRRMRWPFGPLGATLETMLGLPLGQVNHVSFDAHGAVSVSSVGAGGVPFANGIALDAAGTRLAVASSSTGRVHIYARDPATNALTHTDAVQLPFGPDNVGFDGNTLVAAGHPMFPQLLARAAGRDVAVGSWVVSIRERTSADADSALDDAAAPLPVTKLVKPSEKYVVRTLYQSDGSGSGWQISTTGVLDLPHSAFFVSGLYTPGLLQCSTK